SCQKKFDRDLFQRIQRALHLIASWTPHLNCPSRLLGDGTGNNVLRAGPSPMETTTLLIANLYLSLAKFTPLARCIVVMRGQFVQLSRVARRDELVGAVP
ncbi:hypothetical protein MGG_17916, partial [Pyricularia oryzae 70-15]